MPNKATVTGTGPRPKQPAAPACRLGCTPPPPTAVKSRCSLSPSPAGRVSGQLPYPTPAGSVEAALLLLLPTGWPTAGVLPPPSAGVSSCTGHAQPWAGAGLDQADAAVRLSAGQRVGARPRRAGAAGQRTPFCGARSSGRVCCLEGRGRKGSVPPRRPLPALSPGTVSHTEPSHSQPSPRGRGGGVGSAAHPMPFDVPLSPHPAPPAPGRPLPPRWHFSK